LESEPYFNEDSLVKFCQNHSVAVTAYSPLRRVDPQLLNDTVLRQIAAKHHKTVPQVILRWNIQRGLIIIPKSSNKSRQAQNINVFDFNLTNEEMKNILGLKQEKKLIDIPGNQNNPDYPFGGQN